MLHTNFTDQAKSIIVIDIYKICAYCLRVTESGVRCRSVRGTRHVSDVAAGGSDGIVRFVDGRRYTISAGQFPCAADVEYRRHVATMPPDSFGTALDLKLIKLVKQNSVVYNTKHEQYMETGKREGTWESIAQEMGKSGKYFKIVKEYLILFLVILETPILMCVVCIHIL